jgi:hypothetical protein
MDPTTEECPHFISKDCELNRHERVRFMDGEIKAEEETTWHMTGGETSLGQEFKALKKGFRYREGQPKSDHSTDS